MGRLIVPLFLGILCLAVGGWASENPAVFGEPPVLERGPWISERQLARIKSEVRANHQRFVDEGRIDGAPSIDIIKFVWPVRPAAHLTDPGYYGISGFPDHNPSYPGQLLDFNCGERTYDLDIGYNHLGTDIFNWPFLWNKMDNDDVEVVAAAWGIIEYIEDGNYDRSCGLGGGNANVVVLWHLNGAYTVYGHMKNGSLPDKTPGNTVEAGEYLGIVGSSGQSTGPHLHFEVWENDTTFADPWLGPCNGTITESWWIEQKPYYDPAINKISTHTAPVDWGACPEPEITNIANAFEAGDMVYFYVFGRDMQKDDEVAFTIRRPDSTVLSSLTYVYEAPDYAPAFYVYWGVPLPADAETGTWFFDAGFYGVTHTHHFTVGNVAVFFNAVDAFAAASSVEVVWDVWTDERLGGFKVFRSAGGSDTMRQVSPGVTLAPDVRKFVDAGVEVSRTYEYVIAALDEKGAEIRSRPVSVTVPSASLSLSQNHPNPFNPETSIEYVLPEPSVVSLNVYDVEGRLVATLEEGMRPGGPHSVTWDGKDRAGNGVGSGVYFYTLRTDRATLTRKMVILK